MAVAHGLPDRVPHRLAHPLSVGGAHPVAHTQPHGGRPPLVRLPSLNKDPCSRCLPVPLQSPTATPSAYPTPLPTASPTAVSSESPSEDCPRRESSLIMASAPVADPHGHAHGLPDRRAHAGA
jgi:hypothetical protein